MRICIEIRFFLSFLLDHVRSVGHIRMGMSWTISRPIQDEVGPIQTDSQETSAIEAKESLHPSGEED